MDADGFLAVTPGVEGRIELPGPFSSCLRVHRGAETRLPAEGTHYVMVAAGEVRLHHEARSYPLGTGMYASLAGAGSLSGGEAVVVTRLGWRGWFQLGGPLEAAGRLRYIDGCTDALLLSPPVLGDPCLNHLHIPAGTRQSEHTHPSVRAGLIVAGAGTCVTPSGRHPLQAGTVFVLAPGCLHAFHTGLEALDVMVYHPDTDFGPDHHDHPMLNRTFVGGVSRRRPAPTDAAGGGLPRGDTAAEGGASS